MLALYGDLGSGKTSLVRAIHTPVLRHQGYCISGKFEQYERNIPYSAMLQAFRQLLKQILTESDAAIAAWREAGRDHRERLANGQYFPLPYTRGAVAAQAAHTLTLKP